MNKPSSVNIPDGFSRWDTAKLLQTDEDITLYLEACFEEDEGDGALIRQALGVVARAKGINQLAKDTGLSRENLYSALSETQKPEFSTVLKVCHALGVRIKAAPAFP